MLVVQKMVYHTQSEVSIASKHKGEKIWSPYFALGEEEEAGGRDHRTLVVSLNTADGGVGKAEGRGGGSAHGPGEEGSDEEEWEEEEEEEEEELEEEEEEEGASARVVPPPTYGGKSILIAPPDDNTLMKAGEFRGQFPITVRCILVYIFLL